MFMPFFPHVLSDPTWVYLLLVIGVYGVLFELFHPGMIIPGLMGAMSLIVAGYGLQALPINYWGLSLILGGMVLFVAEVVLSSAGLLGFLGCIAFIFGSLNFMQMNVTQAPIAWSVIAGVSAANIVFLIVILRLLLKARQRPVQHGMTLLIGTEGTTLTVVAHEGQAVIQGEIWTVFAKNKIEANQRVRVVGVKGTHLEIEAITS